MQKFWLAFLPLFVAVDAIGILPMFISFTRDLEKKQVHRIIIRSAITAAIVAVLFLAVGTVMLNVLGITVADFLIAGGALLFIISLGDLLTIEKKDRETDMTSLGAVPLGVPLIVGPAVLTAILLLEPQYGTTATIAAIIANVLIAGLTFWLSVPIIRLIGNSGAQILSKIADLLLAAIAIMMIRRGIFLIVEQFKTVTGNG